MRELNSITLSKFRKPTRGAPPANLSGQKFHRLLVIRYLGSYNEQPYWLCRCDCGNQSAVVGSKLKSGSTKSCGCYINEIRGPAHTTHGQTGSLLHRRWADMLTRCRNPKFKHFHNYGGRGISVCERWHTFENFFADMGEPPTRLHQIDRKNNNGNYEPDNCHWVTRTAQARNTRKNVFLTANGETHCVSEWAEILGLRPTMINKRRYRGWTDDECLGFKERLKAAKLLKTN
jgi:hypothetical protein